MGNHVSYLQNWLEALRNDRNYVFKAAKQAIEGDRLPARIREEAGTRGGGSDAMNEIVVIFRRDRTGECFALFPELPGDDRGFLCTAYQRVGQHCAADYDGCVPKATLPLPPNTPTCSRNWKEGDTT